MLFCGQNLKTIICFLLVTSFFLFWALLLQFLFRYEFRVFHLTTSLSYYFLFNCFSEQQPLRLNPAEVCEVIAAVSSETYSACANHLTVSSRLSNNIGKPSMDVAVSVLIKLVIDM